MSSSANDGRSGRILAVWVAFATAIVAMPGCLGLAGSRSFFHSCREVGRDAPTSWRVSFASTGVNSEAERCVVMIDPVLADPELDAVPPGLLNTDEVFNALSASIPGEGDEMGTEGVAVAHFLVDETGAVQRQRIAESSGSRAMDDAVLAIGPLSSFSPAETGEGPVEAWVALTVGFRTNRSALQALRQNLRPGLK